MASDSSVGNTVLAVPLSKPERELVSYFEQTWLLHSNLPTREACVKQGFGGALFDKAVKNESFKDALIRRGISLSESSALTPEQLTVANLMQDLRDNRSQRKKLQECGVTTAKYEAWLRDPAFQSYLRNRSENMLGDNLHESHLALVDRVRSGDVSAIKYFNEITGRYVPQGNEKVDVNGVLMKVLEIIQRHVTDANALSSIAADFLLLADTSQPIGMGLNRPRQTLILDAIEAPVGDFGDM